MGRIRLIRTISALLVVLAFPAVAWAQDGAGVIILKFDTFDTSPEVVKALSSTLEAEVDAHPDMFVKPGGELTAKDLALSAGCAKPDETCMKMLRDFVDADRVIFGSVQASDEVHLFTIRMFDFAESRFIGEVNDATVEGDSAHVTEVIPALVEGVLYGNVGTLTVDVAGAESTELFFDGEKLGLAPTTLENLPLGEHVVTLRTAGGEQSQSVVLRRGQPANLSFEFDGAGGGGIVGSADTTERPSLVPGIVSIGVGVVGLAVGGFGSLQVVDAENKNADLAEYTEGNAFRSSQDREAAIEAGLDPNEIDQQGRTYQTVQWVGYGIGIAGIGLGTYLLVRAMGGSSETAEASAALPFDFGVAPSKDGIAASLRVRF